MSTAEPHFVKAEGRSESKFFGEWRGNRQVLLTGTIISSRSFVPTSVYCTSPLSPLFTMLVTTVNATQKEIAPLMFDLIKIQDYHPLMGTAKIIGDQTEGVGK